MLLRNITTDQAVIGTMSVVLIFRGQQPVLCGNNLLLSRYVIVLASGSPTTLTFCLTQSNAIMKKFRNSGWRFLSKVEEILPSGNSLAHGPASHNPVSSSTQGTTTSTGTSPGGPVGGDVIVIIGDGASHAASVSNLNVTGDGASNMVAAASDDTFGWGQCASALQAASSPEVVAGSSSIPPPLSSASSMGKHSHSDMTLSHSAPPSTTYTSASQMPSDKKPKLSARASSSKLHASAGTSKKAAKEAASTAAWMNLQGSINHLTDGLTSFATTDESRAADETSCAPGG